MAMPSYKSATAGVELSVVIPAFNEQDSVVPLWRETRDVLTGNERSFEIIFVDDGSTDATFANLKNEAAGDPRLVIVRLTRNCGQSAAMAAGVSAARGKIVAFLDGDGQNDPTEMPAMLTRFESLNIDAAGGAVPTVVCGWRRDRRDAGLRCWVSRRANDLIGRATGVRLHDYGCTLKLFPAAIIRRVPLYGELHRFMPVFAHAAGARIVEMAVRHRPRNSGTTKYGLDRTLRVILDLATVRLLAANRMSPMRFFGAWAWRMMAVAISLAAAGGLLAWRGAGLLSGMSFGAAVGLGACGIVFVGLGLLGELQNHAAYAGTGRVPYDVAEIVNDVETVVIRMNDGGSDAAGRARRNAGSRDHEHITP